MAEFTLVKKHTSDLSYEDIRAIETLMIGVYEGNFTLTDLDHALGGIHVLMYGNKQLVGHVSVVQRNMTVLDVPYRVGYVEALGVKKEYRKKGMGHQLMKTCKHIIKESYHFGVLSTPTNLHYFFQRLNWQPWLGQLSTYTPTGLQEFKDENQTVFIYSPNLSLDLAKPLISDFRGEKSW
ncbi:GNAT family N-acetyltransferase [Vagococcus humatus]|uniref:N-acetyltransferase domain-containing protein n=1 Tax=Vagococcus humatus TaxID=1889241 RepID=A0A3S0AEG6_9ENTE|nr:GNAT family N-acetyltransferase [Vagococcus humatus]RST89791.1 hypothetical protein C7P63_01555 [Vagococcus humatus]